MQAEMSLAAEKVIDKIADRIGVAAEQLQPLATETVQQYQLEHAIGAILWGGIGLLFLIFVVFLSRKTFKIIVHEDGFDDDASAALHIIPVVISSVMGFALLGHGYSHLARAIAPLPHLLGIG